LPDCGGDTAVGEIREDLSSLGQLLDFLMTNPASREVLI